MINKRIVENKRKLFRCHYTFFCGFIFSIVMGAFMLTLAEGLISEGGRGLAAYAFVMALVFFWMMFIFYKEDKILSKLIINVEVVDSIVQVGTLLGSSSNLNYYKISILDESWMKKRKIWSSYFIESNGFGVNKRYSWKSIKCISLSHEKNVFYWISDNKTSDFELLLSKV